MTVLAYWVHDLSPFIIKFSENFGLRWYGLSYVLGFVTALWLLNLYYRKGRSPWNPDQQATVFWVLIAGVVLGGRLGYMLLYDLKAFVQNPLIIVKIWEGGMASHGGFIGCILAGIWISRSTKTPFLKTADIACTITPPGLFFGRIANFINGELWGKVTDVPWAVIFPQSGRGLPPSLISPRHPSQLYEAALEGLILGAYIQLRFWLSDPRRRPHGQLWGEFLAAYAVLRMIGERFREPDEGLSLILGLSRGTFYSLFLLVGGIGLIVLARWKKWGVEEDA